MSKYYLESKFNITFVRYLFLKYVLEWYFSEMLKCSIPCSRQNSLNLPLPPATKKMKTIKSYLIAFLCF